MSVARTHDLFCELVAFGFVGLYMGNTISGGLPLATGRVKARKARTTKVNDLVAVKAILWLDFFLSTRNPESRLVAVFVVVSEKKNE